MTYPPPDGLNDPTRPFGPPPDAYRPPPVSGPPYPPASGPPAVGYPSFPPYGPPPGPYPPPPAKKGGKTTLIVLGSIVGGLVLLCVIGAVAVAVSGSDESKVSVKAPAAAAGATTAPAEDAGDDTTDAPKETGDDAANFNVKVGSTLTVTADDGGVQETTVRSAKLHKGACGGFGAKPDNGSYLIVDVLVTQKKGTGSVNPLYFTFVGADGTTADGITGAFSGCDKNNLDSTNALRAGQKRTGQVVFDVKSAKGAIELGSGFGSDAVGSWKAG